MTTCFAYDKVIGDPELPGFQPATLQHPFHINSSKLFAQNCRQNEGKQHLQPVLNILKATSVPIAQWYQKLSENKQIQYCFKLPIDHPDYTSTLAFQSSLFQYLLLSPEYWKQSDFEKAAILVHEYRHHKQNFPKVMFERAWQAITLQVLLNPDNTRLEREAYAYQEAFYKAYGL